MLTRAMIVGVTVLALSALPAAAAEPPLAKSCGSEAAYRHEPCVGRIQAAWPFGPYDAYNPSHGFHVHFGPIKVHLVRTLTESSEEELLEYKHRLVIWESARTVEITGVYIVRNRPPWKHPTFERVATGSHSGQTYMPFVTPRSRVDRGSDTTQILLEGRQVR
jgi:hypothetical protein